MNAVAKVWQHNGLTVKMSLLHMEPTNVYSGRRRVWRLLKPFKLDIESTKPDGVMHQCYRLPAGFTSDFASMPLASQLLLGGRDDFLLSSLVHDAMCNEKLEQFIANGVMRILMQVEGVALWRRWLIYQTLMIFGYGSLPMRLFSYLSSLFKRSSNG